MTLAANQQDVGDKLSFFRSPTAGNTKCLVWAHGGLLHGDGQFTTPVAIRFSVAHGEAFSSNPTRAILYDHSSDNLAVAAGQACQDYSLGKAVGDHWKGEHVSYHDVARLMQTAADANSNWSPHVVVVRRRFRCLGRVIKLSKLIEQVMAHEATIDTFYCACCRGDHSNARVKSFFVRI
jgi:hypothetical protein